jgi:hypothetical protein
MEKRALGLIAALILLVFVIGEGIIILAENYNFFTGEATGVAKVEVECMAMISLPANSVDFGKVLQGTVDDTTDNNPSPLIIRNDGQIRVDISISRDSSSGPLFGGTNGGDNSSSFQFKADRYGGINSFNWSSSKTNWTNIPGTDSINALTGLKYTDLNDSAEIDLKIQVPNDEPAGVKNETLLFTASASDGADCGDEAESNDAECLVFDLNTTKIAEIGIQGDENLVDFGIENICGRDITLTRARVEWINDTGEKIEKIELKGIVLWQSSCGWGCSPTGKQASGALLDFGSRDYTLAPYSEKIFKKIQFDSNMKGKTFKVDITLSDNSIKSTGYFNP